MDYEWLKKLQINSNDTNFTIYENFISLKNNIRNKDKNINVTLRIVAESLLQYLNNKYNFIDKNTKPFLNNVLADFKCISVLQSQYHTVAGNCYTWLKGIQKNGNNSVHGNMKIFDKEDVKNKFLFLMDFAYIIFKKNYKDVNIELNKEIYLKEFENCYNNKEDKNYNIEEINEDDLISEKFNENDVLEKIKVLNIELEKEYKKLNYDSEKFINKENIESFKIILSCIIEIVLKDINCKDINELKSNKYSELYEFYKFLCIDNLDLSETEIIINVLKAASFEMRRIIDVKYDFRILDWLTEFIPSVNTKEELSFYEKVAQKVDDLNENKNGIFDYGYYYIDSQKPFIIKDKIYYQISVRKAIDVVNKSSHRMMFSKDKLLDDYASKITFSTETIDVFGRKNKIFIIQKCDVAIRPCELREIVDLIALKKPTYRRSSAVYKVIMNFINIKRCNLLDIILNKDMFNELNKELFKYPASEVFIEAMVKAKDIIEDGKPGHNILRYLIANLENRVLKQQHNGIYNDYGYYDTVNGVENRYLSNLNIIINSQSFDKAPYSLALYGHNPSYEKLIKCINPNLYYEDVFARKVRQIASKGQTLFTDKKELEIEYEDVNSCIRAYNEYLKKMCVYNWKNYELHLLDDRYIYMYDEVQKLKFIISKLEKMAYNNYEENIYEKMRKFIENKKELNTDQRKALEKGFRDSNILILNGEAGSGKTELICNYLTEFFSEKELLYIATTNSVVNNMKKRVRKLFKEDKYPNFKFINVSTAKKYSTKVDVVFFDECKSINNLNMFRILEKINFKYAVFVGDIGQIPSVGVGNWFNIACQKLESFDLTTQHRTDDKDLIEIWQKVRKYDKSTIEVLSEKKIIEVISEEMYSKKDDDEIILCLNYGGPYGINSINSYFQNNNDNKEYRIKELIYKINDPIVFNELANHDYYKGVIYNNLKGTIKDIVETDENICFSIELDKYVEKEDLNDISNIEVLTYNPISKKTILCFKIQKEKNNDDYEGEDFRCLIPFNVSYAVSIHKSQGLQYNSVKLIITPESEEIMNNEIFYTAITRAKKFLKIYITNESAKEKLNIISEKENSQDIKYVEQPQKNKKVEINDKIVLKNLKSNKKSYFRIREITKSYNIYSAGYRGRPTIGEYKTDNPSEPERGIISPKTELAQKLLGKKEGDIILHYNLEDENDLNQCEYVIYSILKKED